MYDHNNISLKTFLSGWGQVSVRRQTTNIPKKTSLSIISTDLCQQISNLLIKGKEAAKIHEDIICHDSTKRDACQGDTGAGMFYNKKGHQKFLVALVGGGGTDCGRGNALPGYNTDVSYHVKWIKEAIQEQNYPGLRSIASLPSTTSKSDVDVTERINSAVIIRSKSTPYLPLITTKSTIPRSFTITHRSSTFPARRINQRPNSEGDLIKNIWHLRNTIHSFLGLPQ